MWLLTGRHVSEAEQTGVFSIGGEKRFIAWIVLVVAFVRDDAGWFKKILNCSIMNATIYQNRNRV